MADNDGDRRMASSPEHSDIEDLATPTDQLILDPSTSTPPDSQHHSDMPATSAPSANANGKRPLTNISNGVEEAAVIDLAGSGSASAKVKGPQEFPPKTHAGSGYSWTRAEDEPGYAWLNKKALDERQRAVELVVHKEIMVRNRYGDPFEMAEREQALANSLKLR